MLFFSNSLPSFFSSFFLLIRVKKIKHIRNILDISCNTLDISCNTNTATGPSFLDHFSEQTSEPGPSISLKCVASGHPLPQVTWLLDGMPVPDNSRFRTGDYVTRDSVVVSYVNITSVASQDGGLYVSNKSLSIERFFSLFPFLSLLAFLS